jgi:hypothetical protein
LMMMMKAHHLQKLGWSLPLDTHCILVETSFITIRLAYVFLVPVLNSINSRYLPKWAPVTACVCDCLLVRGDLARLWLTAILVAMWVYNWKSSGFF